MLVLLLCGAGFAYFWNHHDKLGGGSAAAPNAPGALPLTGLTALKVLTSLPQHRGPSAGGMSSAAAGPGSRAASAPAAAAPEPAPKPVAPVSPVQTMARLPEYTVGNDLERGVRERVMRGVQAAGVKVLLPSDDAADVDGSADPDRAYMNVTVNANRAAGGVWVETDLDLTRSAFYLRPSPDARINRATAWHYRAGPELYRDADVRAAILSQVDQGLESFASSYREANPAASPAPVAKGG